MLSPLQLKRHAFTAVRLEVNKDGALDAPFSVRTTVVGGEDQNNPRLAGVQLTVTLQSKDDKPLAYDGEFTVLGWFEVAESYDLKKHLDVVRVNAVSLLYGAIRELVMTISARCEPGMLCLPTVSFRDLPKLIAAEGQDSAQPQNDPTSAET